VSAYKVVLAYLRGIEARSIPAIESQVNEAAEIFSEAMDNIPKKFEADGYDFKETVENYADNDDFYKYFFHNLEELFYNNPKRDKLNIDFHIRYQENLDSIQAAQKLRDTVEIILGKKFLAQMIAGWYYKDDKKKFIDEIKTEVGHETIHMQQPGLHSDERKIPQMEQEVNKQLDPYRPKLKELTADLNKKIQEYINTEGRKKFLEGFKKYYTKLLNDSKIRIGIVPPYLENLYQGIINTLPQELIRPALKHNAYMIDKKIVSKYRDYTIDKEWYSYISDPREIMAYAYSLVSKAHKNGMPKEELIKALSEPDKYKKELYPLEFYQEFKKFEDDKNLSAQEKRKIWQKFLKHIHGYIEQIYPK